MGAGSLDESSIYRGFRRGGDAIQPLATQELPCAEFVGGGIIFYWCLPVQAMGVDRGGGVSRTTTAAIHRRSRQIEQSMRFPK
uniref:Uncharacterized protein n=1 Tax=Oryza punctata TaxID=4537 RepID=A0A0E0KS51_ORYPU